jgi:uncharacterized membrane protein
MDVEPEVFWSAVLLLMLFAIVSSALIGLTVAGFNARQTQRPYWSVVRSGLRMFMISVAVFCAAVVTLIALVGALVVVLLLFISR